MSGVKLEDAIDADYDENAPVEFRVMYRSKTDDQTHVVLLTTDIEVARRRVREDPSRDAGELWIEQRRNAPWAKREE